MSKQPLLILVICFITGIFFQDRFSLNEKQVFIAVTTCCLLAAIFFIKKRWVFKIRNYLLMLFFFGAGVSFHFFNSLKPEQVYLNANETIIFKIGRKLNSNQKSRKYEALAEVKNHQFLSIVSIPVEKKELDFRHYYKAKAFIAHPKSPEYDFQFDYAKYLGRKNIFHQSFINGEIYSSLRNDLSLLEKIKQKRLEILQEIDHARMSEKSRNFLKGIILADRTEIDSETVNDFNRTGLVHFLAISGTHIVVIFGMVYFLLMNIFPARMKNHVIVASLLFIWFFALFIGFGNSVLRSCLMISIYFIYVLLQRKPDLLHSMALSAFVILMIDTQQVFDVGFQLSYLAVFGIFWLNQPILNYFPRRNNLLKKILYNTFSISIAAQLATLPLVLYYFHQFSLVSVVANLVIVPFSEVVIVFSFLMTALIGFNLDFGLIDYLYDFAISVLLKTIHFLADFDALYFSDIPMNIIEVFALFTIVYLLKFVVVKQDFRNFSTVILGILFFLMIRISSNIFEYRKDEILVHHYKKDAVISLKQGNKSVFWISSSENEASVRQYIINPYISSRRIRNFKIKKIPSNAKMVKIGNKVYHLQ